MKNRNFYTEKSLQTDAFTEELFRTEALTERSFYTQTLQNRQVLTQRNVYTEKNYAEKSLHRSVFTHIGNRSFYTEKFYTGELLQKNFTQRSFYTQMCLHRVTE